MSLTTAIGDLAIGGFAGFSVGFFAKKFLKITAFIVGGYVSSLIVLSSRGFIIVNWSRIGESTDGIFSKIWELNLSVGVLGAGAVGGFLLGWKSG